MVWSANEDGRYAKGIVAVIDEERVFSCESTGCCLSCGVNMYWTSEHDVRQQVSYEK